VGQQLHAKPFKQFLITLSAIFLVTIVVPWAIRPLGQLRLAGRSFLAC